MKKLLVAINAKYIHTNLAVRMIEAYAKDPDTQVCEYTINEPKSNVIADIFAKKSDVILFSCYIWNISYIYELCETLKKITNAKIVLGGQEVSFNYQEVLKKHWYIDACIYGEGENTISTLIQNNFVFKDVKGVAYRDGEIIINPQAEPIEDITCIPFPYTEEDIKKLNGRLLYYETARGCPFNCSYCMSSTFKGVRYRDIEVVKHELMFFIHNRVKIVKVVDRTFNADPQRAYEIFKFLIENPGETTFHFEIAAHILDDKTIELLKKAPKGLMQFEIGVQTTNPDTVSAINRITSFDKVSNAVLKILADDNIHVHLDLIAGLPYESLESFKNSFNDVFVLRPHVLQLGFLKMLYGTKIRHEQEKHGYKYISYPPYEVLSNDYMSFSDLLELKDVEDVLEKYYNSGIFKHSIDFMVDKAQTPYDLFKELATYFRQNGFFDISHSRNGLFEILVEFAKEKEFDEEIFDLLKFDYLKSGANSTPKWSILEYNQELNKKRFEIIEQNPHVFSEFDGQSMKDIIKQVHFEEFCYDVCTDMKKNKCIVVFKKDGTAFKIL